MISRSGGCNVHRVLDTTILGSACIVAAVIPGTIAVTVAQIIPLLPSSGDIRPILDRSKAKTAYKKDYHGETDYPCLLSFHRLFPSFSICYGILP